MLINFNKVKEYGIVPRGTIHVGMHRAEEYPIYVEAKVQDIIFIEANEELVKEAKAKSMAAWIRHAAVSDTNEIVTFNITNNGESSSILELGDHSLIYPGIVNIRNVEMMTETLDQIFQVGVVVEPDRRVFHQLRFFNILNLDIQGAELKAMKGLTDWSHIEAVFTEVNYREMYKGCALIGEIEEFLTDKGFVKVEEVDTGAGWGDALFVKKEYVQGN
jgi:FkbM family methyltransferase